MEIAKSTEKTNNNPASTSYYHGKEAVARKLAFGSGEIVYNFPWMLVSSFLMFFLTDVALVPALVVSSLFLFVRIFDAIADPVIGVLADRTQSKHGRYRPWLMASGPLLIIFVILLFWAHPEWSDSAKIWYTCIIYTIAAIASSLWNIPFGGLQASLTPDSTERASFASYRILISSAACAISAGIFLPLANKFGATDGDPVSGYLIATIIICVIAVPFIFVTFFGTKEVVHPPKGQKINFSALMKVLWKNPPLIIIVVGFFIFGFMSYGRMTVALYYFSYFWENGNLFSIFTLLTGIITGVTAFFGVFFLKLFKSKKNTIVVGYLGNMILCFILFFMTPANSSPTMVLILLYGSALFNGLCTCMLYAMISDTVEYGQWKSGIRADGFVYSGTTFMLKVGGAISPALLGVLLAAAGYVPGAAQTSESLNLMNVMMNLMPAILCAIGLVIFLFYKLDNKMHAQIIAELKSRGDHLVE